MPHPSPTPGERVGHPPATKTYRKMGRHRMEAVMRVCGRWSAVPRQMQAHAHKHGLENKWKDVMKMIDEQRENDWPTDGRMWPIPAGGYSRKTGRYMARSCRRRQCCTSPQMRQECCSCLRRWRWSWARGNRGADEIS